MIDTTKQPACSKDGPTRALLTTVQTSINDDGYFIGKLREKTDPLKRRTVQKWAVRQSEQQSH